MKGSKRSGRGEEQEWLGEVSDVNGKVRVNRERAKGIESEVEENGEVRTRETVGGKGIGRAADWESVREDEECERNEN